MSSFLAWVSLMKSVSFQIIFLLYIDQFFHLSTCISLLPCRCLSFSSSWHCPHLGGISALLHYLLFWNPLFVPLMSCTSLEMVSLKSRKRRQWSQWPPSPRCLGAKLCGEKCEASCARIYTHACKIGFLASSWKRWHGNTLLLAGLRFSPHKEVRTFHKSLQEVKYARLLGRQGEKKTRVEQLN